MRKAVIIRSTEFRKKIEALKAEEEFPYIMSNRIDKDLSKIEFDWENWNDDQPLGFRGLSNGLPVYMMSAGGDWEYPVLFILYWDGKSLRGYIPKGGNVYNKKFKSAYGNNDDDDGEDKPFDMELIEKDIIARIEIVK